MTILVATAREIHIIPHSTFNPMQIFFDSFDPAQRARSGLKAGNQRRIGYPTFSLPVTLRSVRSLRTVSDLHILKSKAESLKQVSLFVKNLRIKRHFNASTALTEIMRLSYHCEFHFQH